MGIRWKVKREVEVEQDLLVREVGKSMVFDATIDDLRRACEAAGLVVETVEHAESDREDRDALRESLQQMHDERDACLNALAESVNVPSAILPRMVHPTSVLAGIRSLQGRLRDARSDLRESDAKLEAAVDRSEKAEAKLARLRTIGVSVRDDGTIVDVRDIPPTGSRIATLEADLAAALARIAELEAPLPEATVRDLEALADEHFRLRSGWSPTLGDMRDLAIAVAERVRRERPPCLIARAVAANIDVRVAEDVGGGFLVGIHRPEKDEHMVRNVPAAEVPATLARMLTEVGA